MKMKPVALAIAGILMSALSHAQIKKNSLLFGGSLGYASTKQSSRTIMPLSRSDSKNESFLVSPSFATAIADNLFVGADLTWNSNTNTYSSNEMPVQGKAKSSSAGGGIFVRKYWNIVDRFYIFGQGRAGYESFKRDYPTPPPSLPDIYEKGHIISASIYPGLSFALSKKVHLESTFVNLITLQYTKRSDYRKLNDVKMNKDSFFDLTSSFDNVTSFTIGVKVLLSK